MVSGWLVTQDKLMNPSLAPSKRLWLLSHLVDAWDHLQPERRTDVLASPEWWCDIYWGGPTSMKHHAIEMFRHHPVAWAIADAHVRGFTDWWNQLTAPPVQTHTFSSQSAAGGGWSVPRPHGMPTVDYSSHVPVGKQFLYGPNPAPNAGLIYGRHHL